MKLILYKNDVKLLQFKRSLVYVDLPYVLSVRFWLLIPEMNTSRKAMKWLDCFSVINLMLECLLFKKFKKFKESCSLSKADRMSSNILNKI